MRAPVMVRALIALALVWGAVWAVRSVAGSFRITAERIERESAKFAALPPGDTGREAKLRKIAGMIERLDYLERAEHRRLGTSASLFERLTPPEQALFVDLTVMPGLESLLDSMESLPARQRKRFIEQGIREMSEDSGGSPNPAMGQAVKLMEKADVSQLRMMLKMAGPRLKLQLAPLADAVNEALQGMNGAGFGPRRQP